MTFLIIDTNVFLHFTSFDKYPWKDCLPGENDITIVITHPLIDELDKRKYSGKNHLKERATKTLKLFEKYEGKLMPNNFKMLLFNEQIINSYVDSLSLDSSDGDDKILASIIKFKDSQNEEKIFFVTNDTGPRLKAKKFSIECIIPDSKHKLPSQQDELDKTIKALKLENEKLKNRIPKLSVSFTNDEKFAKFKLVRNEDKMEDFISEEMSKIRENYNPFKLKTENEKKEESLNKSKLEEILKFDFDKYSSIPETYREKYNSDLKTYFSEYRHFYLRDLFAYEKTKSLTLEVCFELNNDGTCPAEDIDIYFHFPDGFELFNKDSYVEKPKPPKEPYDPRSIYDGNFHLYCPPVLPSKHELENARYKPSIKKTNSYDVNLEVDKLKHHMLRNLDKLYVVFDDYESIINFSVDYEIRCSNVPDVVKGNLNFLIEKESI